MTTISNNVGKFITNMTKADALAPVVALEGVVVLGRTYQAYKRGGVDEARERAIEETSGSVVWLLGVRALNALGDKILGKVLGKQGSNFDVGTDKILRKPFDNYMKKAAPKKFSATQVSLMKGAKIATSIVLANWFIGFIVPKFNHALTNKKRHEQFEKTAATGSNPSFKGGGGLAALNAFTNAIENTNTGKLLSTDVGIAGGRMYNARTKEERREIAIRDIGSIYFYMWAQGHVGNLLNFVETGKFTRLNPETTEILDKYLNEFLDKNGKEMSVEEFKKAVLGSKETKLPEGIKFETGKLSAFDKLLNKEPLQVAKVSDLESIITDKKLMERIREMAKLQPERVGEAVITKQQVIDAINKCEINNPEFLDKVYDQFTGGAHKDEFKYISNSKLEKLKREMIDYVETICKKSKNGKVNKDLLSTIKKKNIIYSGINFAAGFAVAAAFLSTFIPKIQYYVTKKTTGVDAFPGTYDYKEHHEVVV